MDRHSLCIAGETNIGVGRVRNEDNYCILAPPAFSAALAVVCDGIGGHRDGDVASLYCCRRLMEEFHRRGGGIRTGAEGGDFLAGVLADINARLFRRSEFDGLKRPMGCTAICAVFTAAELAFCGAGDSRLYR